MMVLGSTDWEKSDELRSPERRGEHSSVASDLPQLPRSPASEPYPTARSVEEPWEAKGKLNFRARQNFR
jgi:hypothetical protein